MSKKIDYQNLSSNIIKNSEVTTEDMDETHLTKFFRKTKRKIFGSTFKLCLVVIIIFLLVIFRIRSSSLSSIPNTIMSTTTSVKPTDFYSNAPNIIFHKTHKTGSSSIQNIMYRLGLKHRMPILWGKHGGTGIGYPASFNTRMVINKEKTARISTNHMRNSDELLKMFDERRETFQFTILRHPYSLIKSSYHYFGQHVSTPCFTDSENFADFVNRYDELSRKVRTTIWDKILNKNKNSPHCQNFMSFDLGYAENLYWIEDEPAYKVANETERIKFKNDKTKIQLTKIIDDLDQKMNLVLILEHYWESIILLKEALDLEYEDVIAFKLNRAIPADRSTIGFNSSNPETVEKYKQKIERHLPIDTAIYKHFYQIFLKKWHDYGQTKMKREVAKLKKITEISEKNCKVTEVIPQGKDFFTESQHIPENKLPWHPNNVKITTLLIDVDKDETRL